jgi:D-glycero-D-manno-heptose 1,7-bisphosphate phosphatase
VLKLCTMDVRWVFLDRDGTLNVSPSPHEYVTDPEQLRLLPGAGEAVARMNRAGMWVGVATNQRGVGRGLMTQADLDAVHERLGSLLLEHGARLDGIWVCPHLTGQCSCRKPLPGLFYQARRAVPGMDLARAVLVGDSDSDVVAGRAAGLATIRLGEQAGVADVAVADLSAAADLLTTGWPGEA